MGIEGDMRCGGKLSENEKRVWSLSGDAHRVNWGEAGRKATYYTIITSLITLLFMASLFLQLWYSNFASRRGHLSGIGIFWRVLLTALISLAHVLLSLSLPPLFTQLCISGVLLMLALCLFDMR